MMEGFIDDALDQLEDNEGAVFYGFSVSIDSSGKPLMQEFGNVKPGIEGLQVKATIEPLADLVDKNGCIRVYVELPGVDKKEIDLSLENDLLTISAESARKSYFKELSLPAEVISDSSRASYNNGILEISFEKSARKPKGTHLKIE